MANRYQPIADDLRRLIHSGRWLPGDRLPSEFELATRYRVSTPTLRNALEVLQGEGLVEKRHGSGNYVRRPEERIRYVVGAYETANASSTAVSFETAPAAADGRLSSLLGVPVGAPLTQYTFISHQVDSPKSMARSYVPHSVAKLGSLAGAESPWGYAVRDLLSAAGVQVAGTTEKIIARFPTAEEAHLLHIASRAPVLEVERRSVDADAHVVECALLVLPGDRAEVAFATHTADVRQGAVR